MAKCTLCEIDCETVEQHQAWDEEKRAYVAEQLCDYCWKKFLDPNRAGDPALGGGIIRPQTGVIGPQPPDQTVVRPDGWPNYVPYPPQQGLPLPPGFEYDKTTGEIKKV